MKIVEDSPVILNRSGNQQGKLHPVQTVVWVKRSGGNLLVHFECEEPFMCDEILSYEDKYMSGGKGTKGAKGVALRAHG